MLVYLDAIMVNPMLCHWLCRFIAVTQNFGWLLLGPDLVTVSMVVVVAAG